MIYKWDYHFDEIREKVKPLNVAPFSSERKRMSVIYYLDDRKRYMIFSKGAPEILIENCKYFLDKDGRTCEITPAFKDDFNKIIIEFSRKSLRTLLLCYREVTEEDSKSEHPEQLE